MSKSSRRARLSGPLFNCALVAAAALTPLGAAHAGGTIKIGDGDQSITVGMGIRTSASWDEHGASDGSSAVDFNLDSVRLYVNGQLTSSIGATFNTERDGDGDIKLLDGYVRYQPMDEFNIWAGRMLPPSDRSNLDGPYYISSWSYPGVVSQYPAKFAGRDDGVTVWGKAMDKKLTYAVGVFKGHNRIFGASNEGDNPLFAGRIAFNFFDVEDNPGYYTSSTYYGSANVLTLGFAAMYQKDGVGDAFTKGDYTAWNVDFLFEKPIMDGGAITVEAAYYNYDTDGVFDVAPGFGGASGTDNVGGILAGEAFLVSAGFLIPTEVGIGKFQPVGRYQEFDVDGSPIKVKQYDATLNYIIKGHNARLSAAYSHATITGLGSNDSVTAGVQLQF
jgi:hypothetical protein